MMQSNDSNTPAFPAFPCTDRYVALGAIEAAFNRVSRAIDGQEVAALVIGPPGTGKSLLCGLVAKAYRTSHQVVVLGETPLEDRDALLRHLLHRLGIDKDNAPDGDLHLALGDYVNDPTIETRGLLMIFDEAQKLSPEVIETIRMVTNLTRDGQPFVFALLCGGVKLDETLVDSSLESFTQRAGTRCYLHPMNGEETRYYVRETISHCGADPDATITDEAIAAIHHACHGVPRLINQLVTQAIDCTADADQSLITEQLVDQAWAQLQQLPSPMVEEPKFGGENTTTVEFGELEDASELAMVESLDETESPASAAGQQTAERTALAAGNCATEVNWERPEATTDRSHINDRCEATDPPIESIDIDTFPMDQPTTPSAGISLESSSAVWVDEPVEQSSVQPVEQDLRHAPTLFGEFDQEEEIPVGSAYVSQNQSIGAPPNLESLLQQEIVGGGSTIDQASSPPHVLPLCSDESSEAVDDDSDLLIIEDEVSVLPMESPVMESVDGQSVTVDFQAMLAKMRGAN